MALRARRRQGGSSRGGGRPSQVVSQGGTTGAVLRNAPGTKAGFAAPVGAPPIATPSASYSRRPPPVPTAPTPGPTSIAMRANATSALGSARTQNRDAIFRAVMQLGDPTEITKYQGNPDFAGYQFTQDPNSVFSSLGRQEVQGLQNIDEGTLAGNTFFSGMRLRDRQNLSDETGRQRLAGSTSFLDDLKAYAASLGMSEDQFRQTMADADQTDIDNALAADRVAREDPAAVAEAASAPAPAAPPPAPAPQFGPQPGGTYVTDPSTQWAPDFREVKGHDSHGNLGTWHIYPNGHKVFVRKR